MPRAPAPEAAATDIGPLEGWRSSLVGGLLRTARPKQWLKNVLVFAAPGAAGVLTNGDDVGNALAAFAIFCVVASGVYFVNDSIDVDSDRRHPQKRMRPVAAGVVGVRVAAAVGGLLVVGALALAALVGWKLLIVLAIYVAVQVAYTVGLKHQPILDLAAVASGFVLRAIAGAVAVGVPISQWFVIVATFGSLFMVTGKRFTEHVDLGEERGEVRASLSGYSGSFLRSVLVMAATVTITAYCLWAFENVKVHEHTHPVIWFQLSFVPFTLAMLRYGLLIDQGGGGAPEDLVLSDGLLQALAIIWTIMFALGVYG